METGFLQSNGKDLADSYLEINKNLSDLTNPSAARTTLNIGDAALIDMPIIIPQTLPNSGESLISDGKGALYAGKVGATAKGSFVTRPIITGPEGPFLYDGTTYRFTASSFESLELLL